MADPTYHFNIKQGDDDWHAMRRGIITASTISKLMTGTGKPANNDTSRAMLLQLLAERITGETEPSFYNDDMVRGHLLEPLAREIYDKHCDPIVECGFVTRSFHEVPILGYSPDGLAGDTGLIEIKCPREKNHLKTLLCGKVPTEYVPQVQAGLAVTGRTWCDFISYAPGLPLFVKRCERDEVLIAQLIAAAQVAEAELQRLMQDYKQLAAIYLATEPIQPEQEIIV